MEQIRVGVIGVGSMGQRHCRVYSNLRRTQLVGVHDTRAEIGKKVAQQFEVPYYEQIDQLLDQVDAISIASSTPSHFTVAMRCLERGVHALVEKPITGTLQDAETLALTAEASGLTCMVGHIERFNPAYIELKNLLEDLPVLVFNLRRLSPFAGSNMDVDVVLDLMIHDTNLVLDLVGQEPTSVDAYGLTAFSGVIDHAVTHLCFGSGPLVTMTASRITEQKVRSIEVTTPAAYIECDLLNKSLLVHRRTIGEYLNNNHKVIRYRQESFVERIFVPTSEPLFLELQHFIECIVGQQRPAVTMRDGLKALALAENVRSAICDCMVDARQVAAPKPATLKL